MTSSSDKKSFTVMKSYTDVWLIDRLIWKKKKKNFQRNDVKWEKYYQCSL